MAAFANPQQLQRHFSEHGNEFGAATAIEYEAMASEFLTGPMATTVRQHRRAKGDTIRFCTATNAYGVLDSGNTIRTFYKPVPCSAIMDFVGRAAARLAGRCHDHASNLLYFQWNCTRW